MRYGRFVAISPSVSLSLTLSDCLSLSLSLSLYRCVYPDLFRPDLSLGFKLSGSGFRVQSPGFRKKLRLVKRGVRDDMWSSGGGRGAAFGREVLLSRSRCLSLSVCLSVCLCMCVCVYRFVSPDLSRSDLSLGSRVSVSGFRVPGSEKARISQEWWARCSQSKNNYFTEMCSGSEEGSYLRLIDLCITQL